MFVITGCQVSDGDGYCWVVAVANDKAEVNAALDKAEIEWNLDYGKSPEESGVEFKVHLVEGMVQR